MLIEVECADQPKYKGFWCVSVHVCVCVCVCVCLGWGELVNQI